MFEERALLGRTALATGGGASLGLTLALGFAEPEADLVITRRGRS